MRKLVTLAILVLMLAVLAVSPLTAQEEGFPDFIEHSECAYDLTGETITIYHIGDISGSYAPITQPLIAALNDAITYYNERGGVCGATLEQRNWDTGGDANVTRSAYDEFRTLSPRPQLLVLYSSQDSVDLRPRVAEDQIPVLISAGSIEGLYGENADAPGWVYATNPLYADQLASFCDFVAANPDNFADDPTIGYIGWGAPVADFGLAGHTPETVAYCETVGVTLLESPEQFSPLASDVSTQVENLYDAGANIIYVNALATGVVRVGEAIALLDLQDEVAFASVNWGMDTSVAFVARGSLGANGLPVVDGMYGSLPFNWWTETNLPGIQLLTAQAEANGRTGPVRGITYLLGWILVDTYTEMYIQTANRVGNVADITGADLKETIENLVYEPLGLSVFDFEGGDVRSVQLNRIAQFRFANATMSGIATSGDDALTVALGDGTNFFPPVLLPLTDYVRAPNMVPGMGD